MRWVHALTVAIALTFGGWAVAPVQAQDAAAVVRSPVLLIDIETVFSGTQYGQRILSEIQSASETLKAENQRIADALTAEEQDIAARRPSMEPSVFRAEADAFDEKVVGIRRAQDAKEQELQERLTAARSNFDTAIRPVLGKLMQDREAAVLMARRDVILYFGAIDITDAAIAQIDATLGDGTQAPEN